MGLVGPLAVFASLAACTSASVGEGAPPVDELGGPDGGGGGGGDDPGETTPDAGPSTVTLRQTTAQTITPLNSVGCVEQDADGNPIQHRDNSYYRVFDLAAAGVTTELEVSDVVFGVEQAASPTGSQPATLTLYTLAGPLAIANLTVLATTELVVANQEATLLTAPIAATVPAGSKLVAELFVPDSAGQDRLFFMGSNASGQSAPGYLRATATGCNIAEPTDLAALGFPAMHMILEVNGSY